MKDIIRFLGYFFMFLIVTFLVSFAYFLYHQEQVVKECVAVGGTENECRNIG